MEYLSFICSLVLFTVKLNQVLKTLNSLNVKHFVWITKDSIEDRIYSGKIDFFPYCWRHYDFFLLSYHQTKTTKKHQIMYKLLKREVCFTLKVKFSNLMINLWTDHI